MNFKEFEYEFDLNGYVVLRNIIDPKKISKINIILQSLERKKSSDLPHNVFFGKQKNKSESYISNILEADNEFEKLATIPSILKIMKHITSNFFRLNHAVAMTKFQKNTYTYLHMGNIPHHPKIFYFVKNAKIFSNVTKVVFPICNNTEKDGGFAVIPGSHKASFSRPFNNNPKNNKLLKHVDAKPGDAILFTEALAHGSLINKSGKVRRILSYCYSVGYMPDWTKHNLHYSKEYMKKTSTKIKNLIRINKD
jgi:ectoine hydroxylase-related dioxygenase (phytanoyl-CoA dioxygenase family)|tara:strand:+ start:66 stop:821 length:756 start_codon:yes stop_codon:yes gene_type:complete